MRFVSGMTVGCVSNGAGSALCCMVLATGASECARVAHSYMTTKNYR